MECCTTTEVLSCDLDTCADFDTGFVADIAGIWSVKIETPTGTYVSSFGLLVGTQVPLPTSLLNPQATNVVKWYKPNGTLYRNTCYIVKTKLYYEACRS